MDNIKNILSKLEVVVKTLKRLFQIIKKEQEIK